jgi:phosphate-selective porin
LKKNKLLLIFGLFFLVQASLAEEKTSSEPALKLNGFTQVSYTHWEEGVSEFRIRRARLGLKGDVFKNINYRLQIDATKSPILLDAIVEFNLSSRLGLRIGQFKVPFSQENLASSSSLDTINRSQPVEKLCPGRDIGSYGRDIGVMASGKFSKVEYFLGIFNGAGINKGDLNKQKDIAARLVLHPLDFIQVAAAFYKGHYSSDIGVTPVRRDRSGIEVFLNRSRFSLKGEYIFAKDDQTSRDGWYLQAGCFILSKKLQPIIKYESYDKDREMAGDRSEVMIIGLNLFFTENTKFQINYELHREESGSRSNSALLAQFQAGF